MASQEDNDEGRATPGILQDLQVVEFSRGMAGSLVGMILADHGARVTKLVGPPLGVTAVSPAEHLVWNRSKVQIPCDLNCAEELQMASKTLESVDVVIDALGPGVLDAKGLGYAVMAPKNPRVVYAELRGFPPGSEHAHLPGWEGLVAARVGAMSSLPGLVDREGPVYCAAPYLSATAALAAVQGILAAIWARDVLGGGQGTVVRTSLAEANTLHDVGEWLARDLHDRNPDVWPPFQYLFDEMSPYFHTLPVAMTKDGAWLQFGLVSDHLWDVFLEAIGLESLRHDRHEFSTFPTFPDRETSQAFWAIVLNRVREFTLAEWSEMVAARRNLSAELVQSPEAALNHPQILHNKDYLDRVVDGSTVRQIAPLADIAAWGTEQAQDAPGLGDRTLAKGGIGSVGKAPLEGILILDLGYFYAGPIAASLLADLGARVIKVEPLAGDPQRRTFPGPEVGGVKAMLGKESVALDLASEEGREVLSRLIGSADVIMHNWREGAADKRGLGHRSLLAQHPSLVYVYDSGYGMDGPCAEHPCYAPTIAAAVGVPYYQAPGLVESNPPESAAELLTRSRRHQIAANGGSGFPSGLTGATVAAAVLLGLLARARTGRGQVVKTSMLRATSYVVSDRFLRGGNSSPARSLDRELLGLSPFYRLYRAQDGWIFLAVLGREQENCLAQTLKEAGWELPGADSFQGEGEQEAFLETVFAAGRAIDWETRLSGAGVGCLQVREDFFHIAPNDPALSGPPPLVEHPELGTHLRHGPLVTSPDWELSLRGAPLCGEHSEMILTELGYQTDEISGLIEGGMVAVPWKDIG